MDQDNIKLRDIKTSLTDYLATTQYLLKKNTIPTDEDVHDMRVLLKKSRAVLKMIEPQVESELKQKDIPSLKEAAKLMTGWRDSTVHRKTLKSLKKDYPDLFDQLSDNEKINNFLLKPVHPEKPAPEMLEGISRIDELLKKTAYRIRFQNMQNFDANKLLKELEATYLRVVEQFLICRNDPKASRLHEYRKKAKEFLYQLYFFRPLNHQPIRSLEKKLESITRNLGKVNDIAQLIRALDYKWPNRENSPALDELVVRMRERQDKYLRKIWPASSRIFSPGKNLVNVLGYKVLVI